MTLNSTWSSLGLDSLDEVELMVHIEEEFVIDIQDEIAVTFNTLKDVVDHIAQHPFAQ